MIALHFSLQQALLPKTVCQSATPPQRRRTRKTADKKDGGQARHKNGGKS